MCQRHFFRIISQNEDDVGRFRKNGNDPFHFACRRWILYYQSNWKDLRTISRIQYIQGFVNLETQFYENITFLILKKTPLANFLTYYFQQIQVSILGSVPH